MSNITTIYPMDTHALPEDVMDKINIAIKLIMDCMCENSQRIFENGLENGEKVYTTRIDYDHIGAIWNTHTHRKCEWFGHSPELITDPEIRRSIVKHDPLTSFVAAVTVRVTFHSSIVEITSAKIIFPEPPPEGAYILLTSDENYFDEILVGRGCMSCGRVSGTEVLRRCSGCYVVKYCSRECQKKEWRDHKIVCEAFHGDRALIKKHTKARRVKRSSTASILHTSGNTIS